MPLFRYHTKPPHSFGIVPGDTSFRAEERIHLSVGQSGSEKTTLTMYPDGRIEITGNVIVDGDVIANGVSLISHVHTGVMPGYALSGPPAGGEDGLGGNDPSSGG
jgi:phage baseplate assembly protein gpV